MQRCTQLHNARSDAGVVRFRWRWMGSGEMVALHRAVGELLVWRLIRLLSMYKLLLFKAKGMDSAVLSHWRSHPRTGASPAM
ncbi:hypothetical protein PK69_15175 [Xanthomonas phaseoli pv. phaseoli]|nr:hypothetical protein PK69_15175 [Xanthomonas phaseoli pv. phaseoli]QWN27897.1 hypothetical protein DGM85_04475 [Xanthomonas phaseoli pv. phaseoli]